MRPKLLALASKKTTRIESSLRSHDLSGNERASWCASFSKILLASGLLLTATPAESVNFRFLDFSPVRHFTDEDWRLLRETGDDVLENKPDGTMATWKNPKSGASGTVRAVGTTTEEDGTVCRSLRIENRARGTQGQMTVTACKEPGEEWRLVSG